MFRIFSQYVSAKSVLLMVVEGILIVLALIGAIKLRFWNDPADSALYLVFPAFAVQAGIVAMVCLACFYYNDLYDLSTGYGAMESVLRIEQSLGAASLLLGLLYYFLPELLLGRGVLLIAMALATVFVILSRKVLDKVWQLTAPLQRVAILGTGQLALEVARELTRRPDLNLQLVGFVGGGVEGPEGEKIFGFPVLGTAGEMERIASGCGISKIVVALEDRRGVLPIRELVSLKVRGVRVDDASCALSALTGRVVLRTLKPSWFVFSDGFHRSKWNDLAKRVLDLAFGIVGLTLSLPLMGLVAAAVKLDSRGPALYRQVRVGRMNRHFQVLKFRSMRTDAEGDNRARWAAENDPRVTKAGRFIRKYRLDELPQFLNVIRGDMSFVGPRPERPEFVEDLRKTIPYYDERHSIRPGITGWAQVQYSYGASVEDAFNKLEYDLFYLKNLSLTFDLAILCRTIRIALGGHGGR
jgi:sugar transferase (PEP-CTERM system associated)